jgi:hypothetical protein
MGRRVDFQDSFGPLARPELAAVPPARCYPPQLAADILARRAATIRALELAIKRNTRAGKDKTHAETA